MYKFVSFLDKPTTVKGERLPEASCNSTEVGAVGKTTKTFNSGD